MPSSASAIAPEDQRQLLAALRAVRKGDFSVRLPLDLEGIAGEIGEAFNDVVELNLKAAQATGVSGNVYNAGNGGRITINEAWRLLQKIEGVEIPAVYGPPREGDVRDSQADTTAAVRDLGHAPRFSFEEGMRLTLEWYRHAGQYGNPD